jgi:hypothetical protein
VQQGSKCHYDANLDCWRLDQCPSAVRCWQHTCGVGPPLVLVISRQRNACVRTMRLFVYRREIRQYFDRANMACQINRYFDQPN